jgi:hypothetical protein
MHFLTGLNWNISNMKINLWYCTEMKQWRWTLVDDHRPIIRQESGQQPHLRDAMNDVANTVEFMLQSQQT